MAENPSPRKESSAKKRVRFSDSHEVVEYIPDDTPKKPKMFGQPPSLESNDPMEVLEGEISAVCIGQDKLNPAAAAARRAQLRREQIMAAFEDDDEDNFYTADWDQPQAAEEEYDNVEQRFNEQGIPIEPFNLEVEREEGYFDEETGLYVEWKRNEEEDAWIDALPNAPVDTSARWLQNILSRKKPSSSQQHATGDASKNSNSSGAAPVHDLSQEEIASMKATLASLLLPNKTVLDTLRRLGKQRLPRAAAVPQQQPTAEDDTHPSSKKTSTTTPQPPEGGGPPTARHSTTTSTTVTKPPAMPPAVKQQFDKITELSSALMEAGEYSIHSMTGEDILASLYPQQQQQPGSGSNNANSGGIMQQRGSELESNMNEPSYQALLAAAIGGDVSNIPGRDNENNDAEMGIDREPIPAAVAPPAVDTSTDMFADDDIDVAIDEHQELMLKRQRVHDASAADNSTIGLPRVGEAGGGPITNDNVQQQPTVKFNNDKKMELDGFVLDPQTGFMYNSAMGAYFDPSSGLFGDASNGRWYKYQQGQYILVE